MNLPLFALTLISDWLSIPLADFFSTSTLLAEGDPETTVDDPEPLPTLFPLDDADKKLKTALAEDGSAFLNPLNPANILLVPA